VIWFALVIPVITSVLLWKFYHKEVVWVELLAPLGVSVLCIGITQLIILRHQTSDVEYWGGIVTEAAYFEEWDETVPCTHTEYCEDCSTDSQGHYSCSSYACGTQHMFDVDHHSETWRAYNTNQEVFRISQAHFQYLRDRFGNQKFVDLNRDYYRIDGDKYITVWDESVETAEITTTKHHYENRVQASRSVFNFVPVTAEDVQKYSLYDYPPIRRPYTQNPVMGDAGPSHAEGERIIKLINGYLGRSKQVHVYVLIFKNQPRKAARYQEARWVGSNKNEFVIAIGIDDQYTVRWAEILSWTKSERLKTDTRYFIEEMDELDLAGLGRWLRPQLEASWQRREFKEFEYLRVKPPPWAIAVVFLITILVNGVVAVFVIKNTLKEERKNAW